MNFAAITDGLSAAIPPVVGAITLLALSMFAVRFSRYAYRQLMSFLSPSNGSFDLKDLSAFDYISDDDAAHLREMASTGERVTYQDVYLLNLTNKLATEEMIAREEGRQ